MASRNSYRALFLIILVLLISNIVLLYLFVFSSAGTKSVRSNQGTREGLSTILKDSVGFTDQQVSQYSDLRNAEREKLKVLFRKMRSTKGAFYKLTTPPVSDSIANNLADSIGIIQKNIDLEMRNYFQAIRKICTPEQLPAFDRVMSHVIVNRMIGRQNDRNRGNKSRSQSSRSR